jgi:Domain of unknown function (DUF4145)
MRYRPAGILIPNSVVRVLGHYGLSVLALARAILEYAIYDNLNKFNIEAEWPTGKRKTLSHLIDELEQVLPSYKEHMTRVRDCGNDYLHPRKSEVSKALLIHRQATARFTLAALIDVVEALYLAERKP